MKRPLHAPGAKVNERVQVRTAVRDKGFYTVGYCRLYEKRTVENTLYQKHDVGYYFTVTFQCTGGCNTGRLFSVVHADDS